MLILSLKFDQCHFKNPIVNKQAGILSLQESIDREKGDESTSDMTKKRVNQNPLSSKIFCKTQHPIDGVVSPMARHLFSDFFCRFLGLKTVI